MPDLIRKETQVGKCAEFLLVLLADGEWLDRITIVEMATERGLSESALKLAAVRVGIESRNLPAYPSRAEWRLREVNDG